MAEAGGIAQKLFEQKDTDEKQFTTEQSAELNEGLDTNTFFDNIRSLLTKGETLSNEEVAKRAKERRNAIK